MCDKKASRWELEEFKRIRSRRNNAFGAASLTDAEPEDPAEIGARPKNLVGLSLSGGGIRSAIYNDGFLQGLSHRGFLRYVDYLCSVSGGGYIAGHLISQTKDPKDTERKPFHDDKDRRNLGRDPVTGQVESKRLAGVGGYLSRTLEFLPAYLWSFFFSFAFYIGVVGIVATLAALFWRSFDDPVFRSLYFGALGLVKGNELTVAFIPAILLVVLATVSEVGLSIWRLLFGYDRSIPKAIHLVSRKASLVLVVLAILTSIAIFIGNGKTNVRGNSDSELLLNHYAQILAISAGVIQILVFFGRDSLFRSERAEAKQWQKHLQRSVTTAVLLFLVFSMVHWMGREDISGYAQNRDPHLVRGDVTNWYVVDQLFSSYEKINKFVPSTDSQSTDHEPLNAIDKVPESAKPSSRWLAFLAAGRAGLSLDNWDPSRDLSQPPAPSQERYATRSGDSTPNSPSPDNPKPTGIPTKIWLLPKRIGGACIAYSLAMFGPAPQNAKEPENYQEILPDDSVYRFVNKAFNNVHYANRLQNERLTRWNKHLEDRQFTSFLLDGSKVDSQPTDLNEVRDKSRPTLGNLVRSFGNSPPHPTGFVSIPEPISKLTISADDTLTSTNRKTVLNEIRRRHLVDQHRDRDTLASEHLATASTNRILLEALVPGAIQQQAVPSTLVVPPFDQQARRRWLCFWVVMTFVGMIGGLGQNHIATVFQFYRQQLGANFLVSSHDPERKFCDRQLYELNPTDDGLPFPLFLAATLQPSTCNGSYQVEAKPFVLSPLFCGSFDTEDGPISSKQLSFSSSPASSSVTLGDAITLSGAAVTPLMTGNRWLSIILDFFNTGIGQRLCRLDRTGNEIRRFWMRPIIISAMVIIVAAVIAHTLIDLGPIMVLIIALLTCLSCYCIVLRVGSPGLISSLIFPRNRDVGAPNRDDGRSFYVADGGFYDYLGVSELLRRRCELIVVSDTGANIGNDPLGTLAQMCEKASQEMGIRFLDLDHEAPIDFGRLKLTEQRLVHQPYLCMRIRYPEPKSTEGRLFYCQMSITDSDPIEIQHIRNRFPSFPDEPTVNQFYSEEQVSAYRALGYHIANRLCNELQSWQYADGDPATDTDTDTGNEVSPTPMVPSGSDSPLVAAAIPNDSKPQSRAEAERYSHWLVAGKGSGTAAKGRTHSRGLGQPLFDVLLERLLTAYRLACYEELSYKKDDIFTEAIWVTQRFAFPAFRNSVERIFSADTTNRQFATRWLREYEQSADVRSAYRTAVIRDINELHDHIGCFCERLWSAISTIASETGEPNQYERRLTAHLTNIATACQEIHSGRPHSTFQIGGREKLISLCHSFAAVICTTNFRNEKTNGADIERLFAKIDQLISELIELERSVFQGGEHVTTISFAQCMSTMWGRIMRNVDDNQGLEGDVLRERLASILNGIYSVSEKSHESPLTRRLATEFQVTEIRHRLDVGLRRTRVHQIRDALVKAWCIGYFETHEIKAEFDFGSVSSAPARAKTGRKKPVPRKTK